MAKGKEIGHLPLYDNKGDLIRPSKGLVPQSIPRPKDRLCCEDCEHFEPIEKGRKHLVDTKWFKKMMNLYGDGSDWKAAHFGDITQYSICKYKNMACHQYAVVCERFVKNKTFVRIVGGL